MVQWFEKAERVAAHRYGPHALAATAFADSSFFPIPPDVLLVPMAMLHPRRLWRLTAIAIVASSLGALFGYAIGFWFWESIGAALVERYGYGAQFADYREAFAHWGVWIIILKALTPIPFKFVAIAAGLAEMNLWSFALAVVTGRVLHFLMVAGLLRWLGAKGTELLRRYERRAAAIAAILLVGLVAGFTLIEMKRMSHHQVAASGATQIRR
jgi:membrane protein YqaA with SNARE-associated domain